MSTTCGGCDGKGSHRRWCPKAVGHIAASYGQAAEACERYGDMVGPNDMGLANTLWSASARLRAIANEHKARHQNPPSALAATEDQ